MKVSVCMITYNHEKYIIQALESILTQKVNFDFEIIIGDDFSQDKTASIVHRFYSTYQKKIVPVLREKNSGMMNNFVDVLQKAKGKYIAILEGDDYWTDPNKLQKQVDFLEANEDFSICFHNADIVNSDNNFIGRFLEKSPKETTSIEDLLTEKWYIPTASMVYRNTIKSIPKWFYKIKNGDYALQLLLTSNGEKIKYLKENMSAYRKHDTGISNIFHRKNVLEKALISLNQNFNKYTKQKYNKLIKLNITNYSLKIIRNSSKFSIDFWIALIRYFINKKFSRKDINYLIGHIFFNFNSRK